MRCRSLFVFVLAAALSVGCSAITDFDRSKIGAKQPNDGATDAETMDGESPLDDGGALDGSGQLDGSEGNLEAGGESDGQTTPFGCEPGAAGVGCTPCEPGTYCAGGNAEKLACPEGQFDHDLNSATPCVLQRDCIPGEFVSGMGSPTTDRSCAACASGRFSTEKNAPLCSGWTRCEPGEFIATTGTAASDQACQACDLGYFSDAPNSGQCVPYGACAPGTKETTPGVAGPCTTCMIGEYCAGDDAPAVTCADGTWDHDANPASPCIAWTPCGPGSYVSTDGGKSTDRVCSECGPGTFTENANATECAPWSNCVAGQYASASGSAAKNRSCAPCPDGRFSTTVNVPACSAFETCTPGTYVSKAGTAQSDRACSACPSGQFNAATNVAHCTPWTSCEPGGYVAGAGTESTDQACEKCPQGSYTTVPNSSMCIPQGQCAAGTRQVSPGTATSPPVCAACSAGQYCAGGTAGPMACGSGTWDHDQNPATACVPWTNCSAGNYVSTKGSATSDRMCARCTTGSFSGGANADACTPWTSCAAGRYVSRAGSDTRDRSCGDCTDGTFTASPNLSACTPHRSCVAGQYVIPPAASAINDRSCAVCASGSYSTATNAAQCTLFTTCEPGSYVKAPGTTSADRVCETCPTNKYSTTQNAAQCLDADACQPGTRQTKPGTTTSPPECTTCPSGWYCPGGTLPGAECVDGSWDDDANSATACTPWSSCDSGTHISAAAPGSTTADRMCVPCEDGKWQGASNQAACKPYTACTASEYQEEADTKTRDRKCTLLTVCMAGQYVSTPADPTHDRMCSSCNAGAYSTANNVSACTLCAEGTANNKVGSSTASDCVACATGFFAATQGATMCMPLTDCGSKNMVLRAAGNATQNNVCACGAGQHVVTPGSIGVDPTCTACESSTFNPPGSLDASACTPWTACGTDQYETSPPSPTADRGCADSMTCNPGYGASGGSPTEDRMCTQCTAGTASPGGTAGCTPCGAGTISAAGASSCTACGNNATTTDHITCTCDNPYYGDPPGTACALWSDCGANQYVSAQPTATTDRGCMPCPNGGTSPGPNSMMSECVAPTPTPDAGVPDSGGP